MQGTSNITVETRRDGTTVASELFARYPCRLHLTRIENCEDDSEPSPSKALTCYVLGYGGGLISGDEIQMNINVKVNAKLLITSQSTSKAFKAIPGREKTVVKTLARVARGGLLFLVPQPMQCFGNSALVQDTKIILDYDDDSESGKDANDPSLLLVDWYTGGRENLDGGLWQLSSYHTKTTLSYSTKATNQEANDNWNEKKDSMENDNSECFFRDATRLSGGKELKRHMRDFRIVAMVILVGPKVEHVSHEFMKKYSSRRIYDEDGIGEHFGRNPSKTMGFNKGKGLNCGQEGLLVSCGSFVTCKKGKHQTGVVVRLAALSLEVAANFLSNEIGTLGGQLEEDPFLEILAFKQRSGEAVIKKNAKDSTTAETNINASKISFELMEKSYDNMDGTRTAHDNTLAPFMKKIISTVNPLVLYQLVDSCVPSGGFAHSNTLEAAHQLHLLKCDTRKSWTDSLYMHIFDIILNTTTSIIPFLLSASKLFQGGVNVMVIDEWEQLDRQQRVTMTSHVASRASTTQGSGMLRAFAMAFPQIAADLKTLKKRVLKVDPTLADCTGHASTCFGAVCGLLNIDNETSCSMFLFTTARDMVNAAVRMNLIGPLEGGRLTNNLCIAIEKLLTQQVVPKLLEGHMGTDIAHQICPLIEILSNAHDRLYTRLFNS